MIILILDYCLESIQHAREQGTVVSTAHITCSKATVLKAPRAFVVMQQRHAPPGCHANPNVQCNVELRYNVGVLKNRDAAQKVNKSLLDTTFRD